ncbi:MAG: hypothetical protein ACK5AZ_20830 [Bryobacteraceae bacterium]
MNRLKQAVETNGWIQNYGYDQYGNRAVLASSNYIPNPAMTPQAPDPTPLVLPFTNNRWDGAGHDAAGRQTSNPWGKYSAGPRQMLPSTASRALPMPSSLRHISPSVNDVAGLDPP